MELIDKLSINYNVSRSRILDGPVRCIEIPWERQQPRRKGPPARGLTEQQRRAYRRDLWNRRDVLQWLMDERGLTKRAIREFALGYGQPHAKRPPGLIIPYQLSSVADSYRIRYWPDLWQPPGDRDPRSVKIATPRSHSLGLYPELPDGGFVVLCEGELDAIVCAQHGVPAVSTPGAMITAVNAHALGLTAEAMAVCFDIGADAQARRAADLVRDGGAEAWPVNLGLPNKGDDLSDFFNLYGGTAKQLRRMIRKARPS